VHTQACSGRIQKDRCPPTLHKSPYDIREIQTRLRGALCLPPTASAMDPRSCSQHQEPETATTTRNQEGAPNRRSFRRSRKRSRPKGRAKTRCSAAAGEAPHAHLVQGHGKPPRCAVKNHGHTTTPTNPAPGLLFQQQRARPPPQEARAARTYGLQSRPSHSSRRRQNWRGRATRTSRWRRSQRHHDEKDGGTYSSAATSISPRHRRLEDKAPSHVGSPSWEEQELAYLVQAY
jgi:hypothetical protein